VVTQEEASLRLLRELRDRAYQFTTVSPATHFRVLARPADGPPTLRDIFGWNRPFAPEELDPGLLVLLRTADAVEQSAGALRSKIRIASLDGSLFLHSSFPTEHADSVFFGPDTYRFVRFILQRLPTLPSPAHLIDMGAGSGAGGIVIARRCPTTNVTLVDCNAEALRLAAINATHAGVCVDTIISATIPLSADLVIANPPYMMDTAGRTYRDGGGILGGGLAHDWVEQALERIKPAGTMLLYTGAAYRRGSAPLIEALSNSVRKAGGKLELEELDPDVFGDELESPAYAEVDRIAALGATITLPA
jgi:methylase of polypeptide subunit release factors